MISKETAVKIHNCHVQIENGKRLILDMKEALKKTGDAKLDDAFGGRRDLELGVPSGSSGHRIFGVRFDLGVKIIKEHIKDQKKKLEKLKGVAELELTNKRDL